MKIVFLLFLALPLTAKPTLWIIGDSTVRNNTRGQQGWGDPLIDLFNSEKITVINKAIGGRSSRSFLTQGRWDEILTQLKKGDYVLIQFGHNDGGKMFEGDRPRASIKGNGDESKSGTVEITGKDETVRSFGWYLRNYCQTAQEKGATPIVCSLIPRNIRDKEGIIQPDTKTYAHWAKLAAQKTNSHFIPLNQLLSDRYNALTKEQVDAIFCGADHTHTSHSGAKFHAHVVADAIRQLKDCDLASTLKNSPISLTLPDGTHTLT
ncbi:MAG: rhamnogalacturonan acetylesterase, partial [Akkermansiaceae bacterium]